MRLSSSHNFQNACRSTTSSSPHRNQKDTFTNVEVVRCSEEMMQHDMEGVLSDWERALPGGKRDENTLYLFTPYAIGARVKKIGEIVLLTLQVTLENGLSFSAEDLQGFTQMARSIEQDYCCVMVRVEFLVEAAVST